MVGGVGADSIGCELTVMWLEVFGADTIDSELTLMWLEVLVQTVLV